MSNGVKAAEYLTCEHAWVHTHYPGALVYYIGKCMICGYLDVEDLNQQIRGRTWWRRVLRWLRKPNG